MQEYVCWCRALSFFRGGGWYMFCTGVCYVCYMLVYVNAYVLCGGLLVTVCTFARHLLNNILSDDKMILAVFLSPNSIICLEIIFCTNLFSKTTKSLLNNNDQWTNISTDNTDHNMALGNT